MGWNRVSLKPAWVEVGVVGGVFRKCAGRARLQPGV